METTFSDDGEPMQATDAVEVLDEVGDNDIETLLGFPLLTKAEPYTARAQVGVNRIKDKVDCSNKVI